LFLSVEGQELLIIYILTDDRLPNRHLDSLINSFHGYIAFELDASKSKTNVTLHCVIWRSLLANIELSDRRIVVRNLLGLGHPGVDVNMLVLCLWLECLADGQALGCSYQRGKCISRAQERLQFRRDPLGWRPL
jgi:hypothetical protein